MDTILGAGIILLFTIIRILSFSTEVAVVDSAITRPAKPAGIYILSLLLHVAWIIHCLSGNKPDYVLLFCQSLHLIISIVMILHIFWAYLKRVTR